MQPISVDALPLVRLRARSARLGAPLCLGIDPHPAALPAGFPADVQGIEPFLAYEDRVVYVLARTSNPSAPTIQDLAVEPGTLHEHIARWVAERWPGGRVGLVVGATRPDDLRRLRELVPGPGFLIPGI